MPPRSYPTARQKRLGTELRRLREKAGMSGSQAGSFLGGARAQISHLESGRYGISAERVRRLASFYSATDKHLIDVLASMADERGKGWWEEYRGTLSPGFLDLSELEHHAKYLRAVQMLHVPGILQTAEYAREVMRNSVSSLPALPAAELKARVEHRLRRREIFDRPAPPAFEAFIHEAALRMRYCEPEIMRAQLRFLSDLPQFPTVTVRVIPFDARITPSVHSFLYTGGPIPQLDTVQIDSAFDAGFVDAESQLSRYRAMLDSVAELALSPDDSSKFIRRVAKGM
ncbi:helix-turn-helix transcriptional regulator [Streptomyces sp. UNOC14_S4]|uniref:helix-turn-helix domain-containing protein n=1 Tax=Streptomyces sp. UNOC14_S4 TaxID=2872340 RepID=UPI001E5AD079|nr:helix-turn-helix transcriptional regulator [Streptomyces sp. UNOC14_S4]MCC3767723.1 helix-turn-helix transcriptional regulator [Streptomyces sp. UNOC14_S4]